MEMGDLLCSAPYYQNVRKHKTRVGEILCTGKGCVGCNPKENGDESIVRILGDVDCINFEADNERVVGERPKTAPGCYGDTAENTGRSKAKKSTKRLPKPRKKTKPKIIVTDSRRMGSLSSGKSKDYRKVSTVNDKPATFTTPRFLTVPHSQSKRNTVRKETKKKASLIKKAGKRESFVDTDEKIRYTRRRLYNTFPGTVCKTRSEETYSTFSLKKKTNFLEMLKSSEAGIFDENLMEKKKSSIWIERILQQGVSEDELLPNLPLNWKERNLSDGSKKEKEVTKPMCTPRRSKSKVLPQLSLSGKAEIRGGESILIIEHEHDMKKKENGTLYRLGFTLEEGSERNLPAFSIIEIADSLGEFVQMGSIKVIQRRNRRWIILVEGNTVKDFLLLGGLVLGGRHFELVEIKTF